jgi:histone H1/5
MKAALKRGVDTGVLVQLKHSYKVSAEAKKPVKVKKVVAKPVAKPIAPIKKKVCV